MTDTPKPIEIPAHGFRPVQIATVHGAAVFLAENPDLPMPAKVDLSAHVPTMAVLQAIAVAYGAEIISTAERLWHWVIIPVAVEALHGIDINYTVFYREPETTPMDLPRRGKGITTDPWADAMPAGRCTATWRTGSFNNPVESRCVMAAGHTDLHFYDDDETNGGHTTMGAGNVWGDDRESLRFAEEG